MGTCFSNSLWLHDPNFMNIHFWSKFVSCYLIGSYCFICYDRRADMACAKHIFLRCGLWYLKDFVEPGFLELWLIPSRHNKAFHFSFEIKHRLCPQCTHRSGTTNWWPPHQCLPTTQPTAPIGRHHSTCVTCHAMGCDHRYTRWWSSDCGCLTKAKLHTITWPMKSLNFMWIQTW